MRSGSKRKIDAVDRLRRERARAGDHRDHDRLAERAGGREHGRRDDRRADRAQRHGEHRAQRVHAERDRALAPGVAAPTTSASQISAIMIGVIITVGSRPRRASPAPVSCDDVLRPIPSRAPVIRWLPTNGTSTRIADQPVDHRRHRREQPDHRDRDPRAARAGASSTMKIDEQTRDRQAEHDRDAGRQQRAVDQRPGAQVVGRRRRVRARRLHRCRPARRRCRRSPSQLRPLCCEGRPRAGPRRTRPSRRPARRPSNDTAPSVRSARWSGQGCSSGAPSNRLSQLSIERDPLRRDDLLGRGRCSRSSR